MKTAIGKNTLGQGSKMTVDLKTYNRSTHDLSYAWRSSMGVGTLVPCMKILALPGDTFDIDIDAKVLTHPTVGPLFGSYKMQVDIFTCPMRLYIAQLHNNALGIGMDMSKVKIPQITIDKRLADSWDGAASAKEIASSCVLRYLGLSYITSPTFGLDTETYDYERNGLPILMYLDIFKNYYANKQEEDFYSIFNDELLVDVTSVNIIYETSQIQEIWKSGTITTGVNNPDYEQWTIYTEIQDLKGGTKQKTYKYNEWSKFLSVNKTSSEITLTVTDMGMVGKYLYITGADGIKLSTFKLESLDTLREDLLALGTQQAFIGTGTNINTNCAYLDKIANIHTRNDGKKYLNVESVSAGLLLKTYQSDIFNNWINSEWIDGDNGISAITAIDTSSGEFTIDTLNLAKKVYDMLNRIAVSGGTYRDWINTVYTSNYKIHTETPSYEGGMSDEIVFQEVVSNSATEGEPLGTLAGKGTLGGRRKGGKLHIKIEEPSYIIGIVSITPRVDYCQGEEWDMSLSTMNDLHKPALDGIGYQDLMAKQMAGWMAKNTAIGKQPAWLNYMTNYNKTYGTFTDSSNEGFMVLNRYYETPEEGTFGRDLNNSTYIDPSQYNYTFAETTLEAQNFWVQLGFGIDARRVMSAKQIPNL